MKIYIDPMAANEGRKQGEVTLPANVGVVNWTDVCHGKDAFIWIAHRPHRELSRWTHVERKRPFIVESVYRSRAGLGTHEISAHKTLDAAIKAAVKFAAEEDAKRVVPVNVHDDMVKTEIRNYVISTYLDKLAPVNMVELSKNFNVSQSFVAFALASNGEGYVLFEYEGTGDATSVQPSRILLANLLKKARAK